MRKRLGGGCLSSFVGAGEVKWVEAIGGEAFLNVGHLQPTRRVLETAARTQRRFETHRISWSRGECRKVDQNVMGQSLAIELSYLSGQSTSTRRHLSTPPFLREHESHNQEMARSRDVEMGHARG
jgi:hypothetical protein